MSHSLKGKVAIITGSTSGIGLGLAQSLVAAGADIMLNGFGDLPEIERLRTGLAATHGIRVGYNNIDHRREELSEAISPITQPYIKTKTACPGR